MTTAEFSIRPAAPADVAAVVSIYGHHVRTGVASFDLEPPSLDEMRAKLVDITENCSLPFLVAEGVEGVYGYAYASPYRPRVAYRHTVEDSAYVAPGAERRGAALALLNDLTARG